MNRRKYFKHKKFKYKKDAKKHAAKLRSKGYTASLAQVLGPGSKTYYKVYKYA